MYIHRVEEKGCGFLSGQKSASDPESLTQDRGSKQIINFLKGQRAESDLQAISFGLLEHLGTCLEGQKSQHTDSPCLWNILEKVEDLCNIFNYEHQ